ncbi:MAG: hypothetical protein AB8H79_11290 [Myxococcota bacterium]
MPQVQPFFNAGGGLCLLVCEPTLGVAVVVDPSPDKWDRYVRHAERLECTIAAVLGTRTLGALPDHAPGLRIGPVSAKGEVVDVQLAGKIKSLPPGLSSAMLRVRGLFIGVMVVSSRDGGELAFVVPDGALLLAGGRLCGGEVAAPVSIDDLVPDWTFGLLEHGEVFCTSAPHGIFTRPIEEEIRVRDTTRSRILRRLQQIGDADHSAIVAALGLSGSAASVS